MPDFPAPAVSAQGADNELADDGPECDHPPRAGGACLPCALAYYQQLADRRGAEIDRLHTWRGLMSLLDEYYPPDVVDGSSGDPGPRIVVLAREVDRLRALESVARTVGDIANDPSVCSPGPRYETALADLRAALSSGGTEPVATPTQDDVAEWLVERFGPDRDLHAQGQKLDEETKELLAAIAGHLNDSADEEWAQNLRDEAADVVICCMAIALTVGFELPEAVAAKWGRRKRGLASAVPASSGDTTYDELAEQWRRHVAEHGLNPTVLLEFSGDSAAEMEQLRWERNMALSRVAAAEAVQGRMADSLPDSGPVESWSERDRAVRDYEGELSAALATETAETLTLPRELLASFADPCWFDHNGGCQAHGYLSLEPGEVCPQAQLNAALAPSRSPQEETL